MGIVYDIVKKGWLKGGKIILTQNQFDEIVNTIGVHGHVLWKCDLGCTWKLSFIGNANKAKPTVRDIDCEFVRSK